MICQRDASSYLRQHRVIGNCTYTNGVATTPQNKSQSKPLTGNVQLVTEQHPDPGGAISPRRSTAKHVTHLWADSAGERRGGGGVSRCINPEEAPGRQAFDTRLTTRDQEVDSCCCTLHEKSPFHTEKMDCR